VIRLALGEDDVPEGAGRPSVAGDFNGWTSAPLEATADGWSIELDLPPGAYHYAFVTDAGVWFVPLAAQGRSADGFGGYSAILVVREPGR